MSSSSQDGVPKECPAKEHKFLESFSTLTISSTIIKTHYLTMIVLNARSKKDIACNTNSNINGREKLEKISVPTKPVCQLI